MKKTFTIIFVILINYSYGQLNSVNAAIILPNNSFITTHINSLTTEEGLVLKNKFLVASMDATFAYICFDFTDSNIITYAKKGGMNGDIYFKKEISLFLFKHFAESQDGNKVFIYEDEYEPFFVVTYEENTQNIDIIYYPFIDYNENKNLIYTKQAQAIPKFDLTKKGIVIK